MRSRTVALALCVSALLTGLAVWAMRTAAPEVEPVVHKGVKYVAPNDDGRTGYVEARDAKTGGLLWKKTIFTVKINPFLEEDVQWVFVSQVEVRGAEEASTKP